MKKLMVMGIVSLMFTPLFAQFGDGNIILGGSFSILSDGSKTDDGTNEAKDPKDFEFQFGPHVHYMLSDHMSVGGRLFYEMMTTTNYIYDPSPDDEVKEKHKANTFGIGPEFRYWWPIGEKKKFGLFAEAGLAFATTGGSDENYNTATDETTTTDRDRTNTFSIHAAPGMFYAPAECFFFEITFGGFGLQYNYDVTKDQDTEFKTKDGYFKLGGDLDELFFGNTAIGFNVVF